MTFPAAAARDVSAKYLYLAKPEYVAAWVNGGDVPISKASAYRSADRSGTLTFDETRLEQGKNLTGDEADFIRTMIIGTGSAHIETLILPGGKQIYDVHLEFAHWDGHILCFSNSQSKRLCTRLRKRACVRIRDPEALFGAISEQLGVAGSIGECTYTHDPERSVFTKSYRDAWQDEFRMFWSVGRDVSSVRIPPGTGRLLWSLPPSKHPGQGRP